MLSSNICTRSMTRLLTQVVCVATDQTLRVGIAMWDTIPSPARALLLDTLLGPEDPTEYVSVTSTPMRS